MDLCFVSYLSQICQVQDAASPSKQDSEDEDGWSLFYSSPTNMAMQVITIFDFLYFCISYNWTDLTDLPLKYILNRLMKKSLSDRRLLQELLRFVLPLQMQ